MPMGSGPAAICWHEPRMIKIFSCSVFKSWLLLMPAQCHAECQLWAWPAISRHSSAVFPKDHNPKQLLLGVLYVQMQAVVRHSVRFMSRLSCVCRHRVKSSSSIGKLNVSTINIINNSDSNHVPTPCFGSDTGVKSCLHLNFLWTS